MQTYSNGEVVRWVDPGPEVETPALQVAVLPPAEEEEAPARGDDDSTANVALIVGIAGLAAGLIALGVALFRVPKAT